MRQTKRRLEPKTESPAFFRSFPAFLHSLLFALEELDGLRRHGVGEGGLVDVAAFLGSPLRVGTRERTSFLLRPGSGLLNCF
jgi:hypothetical protein